MPGLEEALREELKRVAERVQPSQLRPLQAPVRTRRGRRRGSYGRAWPDRGWPDGSWPDGSWPDRSWQGRSWQGRSWQGRLLPFAAGAAVLAIIAVAALLTGGTGPAPAGRPATPAVSLPRFYVTIVLGTYLNFVTPAQAVVRDSSTGKTTGAVTLPPSVFPLNDDVFVAAVANDRSFIIAADKSSGNSRAIRLFRLNISSDGRPLPLTELPEISPAGITGMAVSPDGSMLAISLADDDSPGGDFVPYGGIEVVNLATGQTRSWYARGDLHYFAAAPTWVDGDQKIAFTWWHSLPASDAVTLAGVRQLDTALPGGNLLDAPLTPVATANDAIESAAIAPDGRDLVATACRATAPAEAEGQGVAVIAQTVELAAEGGRLQQVGVLHTQTFRYSDARYFDEDAADMLADSCDVLSVDASGQNALIQGFQFGRVDGGVFTALPGVPPDQETVQVVAAW
jgi:hypothetical protein